ncbi:MAG: hypothetical protein QM756_31855 [Polyangiaceae bacterium]
MHVELEHARGLRGLARDLSAEALPLVIHLQPLPGLAAERLVAELDAGHLFVDLALDRDVTARLDLGRRWRTREPVAFGRWLRRSGLFLAGGRGRSVGCATTAADAVERGLRLGRRQTGVELDVGIGRDRRRERFLRAGLIVAPATAHDADVHPRLAQRCGAALVFASLDRARQHRLGLVEVRGQVVRVDGLVDLLVGRCVARELTERRQGEEDHQAKGEQAMELSMHVSISGGGTDRRSLSADPGKSVVAS